VLSNEHPYHDRLPVFAHRQVPLKLTSELVDQIPFRDVEA
jgi:hypothetical protein